MAPVGGREGSSLLEGWENWQIALAVGAPVCLGLAGLWYYTRSINKNPNLEETKPASPASPEKASPTKSSDSEKTPVKADEVKHFRFSVAVNL